MKKGNFITGKINISLVNGKKGLKWAGSTISLAKNKKNAFQEQSNLKMEE